MACLKVNILLTTAEAMSSRRYPADVFLYRRNPIWLRLWSPAADGKSDEDAIKGGKNTTITERTRVRALDLFSISGTRREIVSHLPVTCLGRYCLS